jgi:hypothetical protein
MSESGTSPRPTTQTLSEATTSEALAQLALLVKHLRSLGIAQYALGDLTLSITLDDPAEAALPEFVPEPPPAEVKRGKDGLTRSDQELLYGWVDTDLRE